MARPKQKLTDRDIHAKKPAPRGKRIEVWDALVPGLSLRVTDKGHKSLCLYAMFPASKSKTPTRRTIGEHGKVMIDDARRIAREWHALIDQGIDPQEEQERRRREERGRQGTTFPSVAEEFMASVAFRDKRKAADHARVIRRELIGPWGDRPITEITRGDLIRLVEAVAARPAPSQAHTVFALVRRIWNWALTRDYGLEGSPCDRVTPAQLIGAKGSRERHLTDAELAAFWRATAGMGYPFGPLFRILLLTGCRRSEVSGAKWDEFDFEQAIWTVPPQRYKTGRAHKVPLTAAVLAEIEALPHRGEFLFQTIGRSVSGFSRAKSRLDARMAKELGPRAEPWVTHDLRRSVRTQLSKLGVSDIVAERVLGHVRGGVTGVYDRYDYLPEQRQALELWAARLRDITEPPPDNVTELPQRRRA